MFRALSHTGKAALPDRIRSKRKPAPSVPEVDHQDVGAAALNWRAHDRTHLELPVPFAVTTGAKACRYEWEAYFFVPESFRLDADTYGKEALQADFKGYVRLAVAADPVGDVADRLTEVEAAIAAKQADVARTLRLFGCRVRRALIGDLERIEKTVDADPSKVGALVESHLEGVTRLTDRFRALVSESGGTGELAVAERWIDEDTSLMVEASLLRLRDVLERANAPAELRARVVERAVREARYRRDAGYVAVAEGKLDSRDVERLEFRRHTLKRFTSSVLWLATDEEAPGRWAKQILFTVAACVAMAFAVLAALWQGPLAGQELELSIWLLVAVFAYGIKDRLKAGLQETFSAVLRRWFPDRRWRIRERGRDVVLGTIDERSGFSRFDEVPAPVLTVRRQTRQHPIEEEARPETVLWHKKSVSLQPGAALAGFNGLLEIFRVDLRRWLTNTDDPKNRIRFADPDGGDIKSIIAPRVYNVSIVYRLRALDRSSNGDADAGWHRVRVVVTRKGIRRIDPIC